eukprot:259864_1
MWFHLKCLSVDKKRLTRLSGENHRVKPSAYTLKNIETANSCLKSWNLEASNDGKTWTCLKTHRSDDSLRGRHKSHTWKLPNINEFYSFFRILMIGTNYENDWCLSCSGMELYGDVMPTIPLGGSIDLVSDASITNYGNITSNTHGSINIKCKVFKNLGRIEAKNGRITIKSESFANESIIDPKPITLKL